MTINELPSTAAAPHTGHRYATVSAHNTSQGRVAYQRCVCGLWRIQRYTRGGVPVLEAAAVDQRRRSAAGAVDPAAPIDRAYASI